MLAQANKLKLGLAAPEDSPATHPALTGEHSVPSGTRVTADAIPTIPGTLNQCARRDLNAEPLGSKPNALSS